MYMIKVIFSKKVAFYLTISLENLFVAACIFSIDISLRRRRRLSSGNEIEGNGRE